jgi:hypothetical protein
MKVRFLLDEQLSPRLKTALLRLAPTADILRVAILARRPWARLILNCCVICNSHSACW